MELRSSIIAAAVLFLLFAAQPISSLHGDVGTADLREEEIYEIDYRGPETHTYLPPPGLSRSMPKKDARSKAATNRNGGNNK